jgi:prepilin-type N-terminal cleavage/methylation domain-containing protein
MKNYQHLFCLKIYFKTHFKTNFKSKGFSIVELMIAMLIGLILIAGVMTIYVSTIKDSRNLLSSASLSQELTAVMSILSNDLRRSGAYSGVTHSLLLKDNPFYAVQEISPETDPKSYRLPFAINISAQQDCVSFAFDADNDSLSSVQENDVFAFRLKDKSIKSLQYANLSNFVIDACANNAGSWMTITDRGLISISELHISTQSSQCINMTTQNKWQVNSDSHLFPCLSSNSVEHYQSGDRLVEMRMVTIRLKGYLTADKQVTKELTQTIAIRNNLMVSIP